MTLFSTAMVKEGEIYGEEVYAERLVAPKWYWLYKLVYCFFDFVWRDTGYGDRLSIKQAWNISVIIYGTDFRTAQWLTPPQKD